MPTAKSQNTAFQRFSDYVDKTKGMIVVMGFIIGGIISVNNAYTKINENEKRWKEVDDKYNAMIKEMFKDNKVQLDDQHELIIKNIQRLSELKERMNEHEISAAEFRGKVKATLKLN